MQRDIADCIVVKGTLQYTNLRLVMIQHFRCVIDLLRGVTSHRRVVPHSLIRSAMWSLRWTRHWIESQLVLVMQLSIEPCRRL